MIYVITKDIVVDESGVRVLSINGKPINNDRAELRPIEEKHLKRARKYVALLEKSKNINSNVGSYNLKHRAEEYLRFIADDKYKDTYVSNGALIVAMLEKDFKYHFYNYISWFEPKAIKFKDIKNLDRSTSLNISFNVYSKQIAEHRKLYK